EAALAESTEPLQLRLNLIDAYCRVGHLTPAVLQQTEVDFQRTRNPGSLIVNWVRRAIRDAESDRCPNLNLTTIEALLGAAEKNDQLKKTAGRVQDLLHLRGLIALRRGNPAAAADLFDAALRANPRPTLVLQQAALLGSASAPDLAIEHLDRWTAMAVDMRTQTPAFGMRAIHAWILERQGYWPTEIAHLRRVLQKEALGPEAQQRQPLPMDTTTP
ncbi:MAG TPA: hypothetical protein VGE47_01810, partial [Burkholderiaceae bacterium]